MCDTRCVINCCCFFCSFKILIAADEAEEFEEVVVDEGNPILPDMYLDPSETHIYAVSPYKVSNFNFR